MLKKIEGKIAVITGGTEGIGLAAAKLFVKEGAYVFIAGRRQKELDEAVEAIGSNVSGLQGHVAKLADLDRPYEIVSTRSFERTWTTDLKDRRIRSNVVSPGPINTPLANRQSADVLGRIVSTIPMGRMGEPEEVAKVALFLASDDSSFVTGIELFVDGGRAQI
jgi:NAD(P)-dependent dehydrogenase (short-subunit alcohol dehydrogenase family)